MWLEVGHTNNYPGVVASYFINCVQHVGGTASVIRGDMGTENVKIAAVQRYLRHDWWITHFKDLRDRGLYCQCRACRMSTVLLHGNYP